MSQQHGVPAFGNWSMAGDTPYTQKFENLRRSKKTGVYSNPNETTMAPIPEPPPPPPLRSPLHPSSQPDAGLGQRQRHQQPHERKVSAEADHPRPAGSPLHREMVAPRRHANPLLQPQHHSGHGGSPRSPYREAAAAAAGAASPRHRYRSAGMKTPDRKGSSSSEGRAPLTPGRSRLKQGGRVSEPASDEATVPPFGDWDGANAESGEKYTGIFNRVRRDKLAPSSFVKQEQQPPSSCSSRQERKVQVQQACSCCIL
ncbi:RPM1-interacting protein 4-like [Oryza brachyantha]|uniref:RPM1-interacting protein 4-like n=1 Tax=Oryza brachyantha TaxID=4533 RepID=UPI0007761278|nr:RPM1-interacting protein 4-like [Oryza brachyantha]